MDARLQRRVQRYGWDRAASIYHDSWQRNLAPAQERLLEFANLQKGEKVLDVASGTGLVTCLAAEAVSEGGAVLGVDLAGRMVEEANLSAAGRGLSNVTFQRMDAEQLQLRDCEFDALLCAFGLMYLPNPSQAIKEFLRVLKPGGRSVSVIWGRRDQCGWAEVFPIVDQRTSSEVCPLFFQLGTGDSLGDAYAAHRFTDIYSERVSASFRFNSADEACVAQLEGGAISLAWSRFDEETKREVRDEYLASIAQFSDGPGYTIPSEFVLVRGRKASGPEAIAGDRA